LSGLSKAVAAIRFNWVRSTNALSELSLQRLAAKDASSELVGWLKLLALDLINPDPASVVDLPLLFCSSSSTTTQEQ
jgi:hypothetical protein